MRTDTDRFRATRQLLGVGLRALAAGLRTGLLADRRAQPAAPVRIVQPALVELGYLRPAQATGSANPATMEALRAFQRAAGVTDDGVAGPWTAVELVRRARIVTEARGLYGPWAPEHVAPGSARLAA